MAFFVGLAVFGIIYGFAPLNVRCDSWIMQGYDESDIIQHYAGWCSFRNSAWHFPLGLADGLAGGTVISYTDSIPLVAIIFKFLLNLFHYDGTFQYFGLYTLACYILQAISAGYIVRRKTDRKASIVLSMILLCFSPILMERAFRHTALGSQYLILFAIYAVLKGRDNHYEKYPSAFYILSVLAITIHPYYIPLVMIFALIYVLEAFRSRHDRKRYIAYFGLNLIICALAGVLIGVLGAGVNISRGGYGYFSMNMNALINPTSAGGYSWSAFFKVRPQILGNYDGFNYLGFGYLFLLITALIVLIVDKKQWKNFVCRNWIYAFAMIFMGMFAVSNIITWNDKELFSFVLPEKIAYLCGIFRASSRMFYAVYYSIIICSIYRILELKSVQGIRMINILLCTVLVLQVSDLHNVIREKHEAMDEKTATQTVLENKKLNDKLQDYTELTSAGRERTVAVIGAKNSLHILYPIANSGDYTEANNYNTGKWNELYHGNHTANTVFVTSNEDEVSIISQVNSKIDIYQSNGLYFILPVGEEMNNREIWFLNNLTDENWTNGVRNDNTQMLLFTYSDELMEKFNISTTITSMQGDTANIVDIDYNADWIYVIVDGDGSKFSYPAVLDID